MRKVILKIPVTLIFVLFLIACDNYEFPKSPYPKIETLDVTTASSTHVTLSGNLIQLGDKAIIDHGFVWGFSENVTIGVVDQGILALGSTSSIGGFQGDVDSNLYKDSTYYIRAFVATDSYKVYGDPVSFHK